MLQELYNQLYVQLSSDMHTALNQLIAEAVPARPACSLSRPTTPALGPPASQGLAKVPGPHQLARLKALADEAEISSDQAAAERYHQDRLVAATLPQVCRMLPPGRHCLAPSHQQVLYDPTAVWHWLEGDVANMTAFAVSCPPITQLNGASWVCQELQLFSGKSPVPVHASVRDSRKSSLVSVTRLGAFD